MSFVDRVVSTVDQQFDQLHADAAEAAVQINARDDGTPTDIEDRHLNSNLSNLHDAIQQLSQSSQSRAVLKRSDALHDFLGRVRLVPRQRSSGASQPSSVSLDGSSAGLAVLSEQERLEWVVLSKVTARTYGLVLDSLLREIVPLESEISYWRDVLSSYRYTSLYSLQTSPLRMWQWSQKVWHEVSMQETGLNETWRSFYQRVRLTAHQTSLKTIGASIAMPVALLRRELQRKQERLEGLKRQYASSIGFLLSQGTEITRNQRSEISSLSDGFVETRSRISRYLAVLDASLSGLSSEQADRTMSSLSKFELQSMNGNAKTQDIFDRLQQILQQHLPEQSLRAQTTKRQNGRPSRLVRISAWFRELGQTCLDFYTNWVLEPGRKLAGTIRHDEKSEVSIMSKRSLEGDRDSLERMVVDFAVQHPEGQKLTPEQIADLQAKVREGDLTPVLKAYERDMQSPLWRSVRGTLIRALLIQIQKTKVDVEVAMGGIDALLKSQELVFGFLSLTPGVLVVVGTFRYLRSLFSERRSLRRSEIQKHSARVFGNLDRILTDAAPSLEAKTALGYEEFGMLVCEAVVLRDLAAKVLPKQSFADFEEDFDRLMDLRSGVGRQMRVVDRMRWSYGRWLL
ncbi:MAG: hypothetical protein Q9162_007655 [Coniocarpon cinnabarinum]